MGFQPPALCVNTRLLLTCPRVCCLLRVAVLQTGNRGSQERVPLRTRHVAGWRPVKNKKCTVPVQRLFQDSESRALGQA